jgi:hypothetical protein
MPHYIKEEFRKIRYKFINKYIFKKKKRIEGLSNIRVQQQESL